MQHYLSKTIICDQHMVQKLSKFFKFQMYIGSINSKVVHIVLGDTMTL